MIFKVYAYNISDRVIGLPIEVDAPNADEAKYKGFKFWCDRDIRPTLMLVAEWDPALC